MTFLLYALVGDVDTAPRDRIVVDEARRARLGTVASFWCIERTAQMLGARAEEVGDRGPLSDGRGNSGGPRGVEKGTFNGAGKGA